MSTFNKGTLCSIDFRTRKKDTHRQNAMHTSGSHEDLGLIVEVPSSGDEEQVMTCPARTHKKPT